MAGKKKKKKTADTHLHSSTPLASFSLSFSVSQFFFYSGHKSDLSLALSDPQFFFSVRTSRYVFLLLQEEKPQYSGVWDEAAPGIPAALGGEPYGLSGLQGVRPPLG